MRAALQTTVALTFLASAILLATEPASARPSCKEILVNGSFEQPLIRDRSFSQLTTVPGWQLAQGTMFELQRNIMGPAADGQQYLELASQQPITIQQRITATPGEKYLLRFSYSPRPRVSQNDIEVRWGNRVVTTLKADGRGLARTEWQEHSFELTADASNAVLEFADRSSADGATGFIDDVRLCRVPSEAKPLSVAASHKLEYECDRMSGYRATVFLNIQGGKPPYVCTGPAVNFPQKTSDNRCSGDAIVVGHHTFNVTDADGSSAQATIHVEWVIQVEVVEVTAPCCGCENGSATVIVSGENPDFTVRWNDPKQQTTRTATGLLAGTYRFMATDAKGCRATMEVKIPSGCQGQEDPRQSIRPPTHHRR